MENERQELDQQLSLILEQKDRLSTELQVFQKEFKLLSDNINHHISIINDLTISENRIIKKIHQLESTNINSEISNSLKNGFIDKIKSIFTPKVKISQRIAPQLEQPKPIKIEEITSTDVSLIDGAKSREVEPSLAKILTEEIMNEEWPLLEELEQTRFSLKNKTKQKNKQSITPVSQKEDIVISQQKEVKQKPKRTAKKTNIKKLKTTEEVDKAISLIAQDETEIKEPSSEPSLDDSLTDKSQKILNNIEVKNTVDIKAVDDVDVLEKPTSKKEGLMLWVKYENPEYKEDKLAELHSQYSNFLSSKFDDLSNEYIYSIKGPSFKLALRKMLSLENEN